MRNFLKGVVLSASIAVATLCSAYTAQAGGEIYKSKPTIWGGLYAGAHIGYAFVDHDADFGDDFDTGNQPIIFTADTIRLIYDADNNGDGPLGGVHLGYNIQKGKFVFGLEGDFTKTTSDVGANLTAIYTDNRITSFIPFETEEAGTITGAANFKVSMDYLASLRARAGYANNNYLLYLTGGIAWTKLDAQLNLSATGTGDYAGLNEGATIKLDEENLTGYVIGAGGEYMVADGMSLKGEVLYYSFDDKGFDFDTTVVRTGLSLQLN